jgi:hypothetical protein
MHSLSTLFILSSLLAGSAQANVINPYPLHSDRGGGVVVGNGGYTIQCADNGPHRSYDLLVAQSALGPVYELRPVTTREESFIKLRAIIAAKLPALKNSFDLFSNQLLAADPAKTYVWEIGAPMFVGAESLPPIELYSNHIELCLGSRNVSGVYLTQTILRSVEQVSGKATIHFYYDTLAFYDLPQLDRSFLLTHEWLWNFTNILDANRQADYILHSTWIEHASSREVIERFKEIGIDYP